MRLTAGPAWPARTRPQRWGHDRMALFLSHWTNKVDKKGRVSVPAAFRAVLKQQGGGSVVCYPSFTLPAIEACGMDRIEELSAAIDSLDPFTEDRDAFAVSILADAHELAFDAEGRILLPEPLIQHAGIAEQATFVGQGRSFQIWEPEAFERYRREARERARRERMNFSARRHAAREEGT